MITKTTSSDTRWLFERKKCQYWGNVQCTDLQYFHIWIYYEYILFLGFAYFNSQHLLFNLWYSVVSFSIPQGQNVTAEADQNLEHLEYALHEIIKWVECKLWSLTPWLRYIICYFHFLKFHPRKNDFVRLILVGISVY